MVKNPRVLGTVRLSVLRDDTTSPERQRQAVEHWASGPAVDGRIVAFAEDLDVSGAMHPFKRPGLGPWLSALPYRYGDTPVGQADGGVRTVCRREVRPYGPGCW